jgi:hypothetical protein
MTVRGGPGELNLLLVQPSQRLADAPQLMKLLRGELEDLLHADVGVRVNEFETVAGRIY